MVNVRLLQFFCVIAVCLCATAANCGGKDLEMKFKLQFKSSKNTYLLGEPVVVNVTFENMSEQRIMLNKAYNVFPQCSLTFNIVKPSSKKPVETMPFLGKRKLLNKNDFIELRKGEKYQAQINISEWYRLDEIGTYKIFSEYTNTESGGGIQSLLGPQISAWVGRIVTDPQLFEITK